MEASTHQDDEGSQRTTHALPQRTPEDSRRAVNRRGLSSPNGNRLQIFLIRYGVGNLRTRIRDNTDHWHRVASDLDTKADDYKQILKTPRTIIDSERGSIHRADPIEQITDESKPKES